VPVVREMGWRDEILLSKAANLALEVGAVAEAAKMYRAILEQRPYMVGVRYNLGLALKQSGRATQAEAEIRRSIEEGLRSADAWNNLGLLSRDLGLLDQAERDFLNALREDPGHWHAAYNLARLYVARGRISEAREMLTVARHRAIATAADTFDVDELIDSLERSGEPPGRGR